jgi:ABC-2 type transport system ATP-binding protein
MAEMIATETLLKRFGTLVAVDQVSLSVAQGEVLGFLGPNGAGKTTTMRMIAGFLEPNGGTARVCGFDVVHQPIEVKRRLGYLPEGAPLYGDMSCTDFLAFIAGIRGFRGAERRRRVDRAVEMVSLGEVIGRPIETLSKGFKRRVGLAQALLHDPEVLILDEPTDGLDPNQKQHVRALIQGMAREKAIIVSTHILEEVEAVCTRAVVIARGRIVADGTAESLLRGLPEHRATIVHVRSADADRAAKVLAGLAPAAAVQRTAQQNGIVAFRVPAADGQSPILDVAHALKTAGVTVETLYVAHGRLDDVFRNLTTDDRATGREATRHG